jgi:signal transduction histidine kinase
VRAKGDLYEPLADEKGITLKIEAAAAAWVRGNRELISQALSNLVDNAIKYGASDGAAANGQSTEVVLKAMDRGDRILISVADGGPGIAESDRGRVLERFVRLEQSRSEPGSGLGLSLAAAIARLHGGELTLEDNHPGLVSVISLPRVAAPMAAASG